MAVDVIELDKISCRIGDLYQRFGRLQHKHAIQDDDVTVIMDELVKLSEDIERITDAQGRIKRGEPNGFDRTP